MKTLNEVSPLTRHLALGVFALFTFAGSPLAALEPMVVAPENAEVVARINVSQSLQAPLSEMLIDKFGRPKIESTAKLIQNLTDVNLFADVYEAWLFGQIDSDEEVLILARGKFNETKLVDLLRVNNTFKETTYQGEQVYNWVDENGLPRWAVFIDQYLAIGGTNKIINNVIERKAATSGGYQQTPLAKALPQDVNSRDAWCLIASDRARQIEFGAMAETINLKYFLVTMSHTTTGVSAQAVALPNNPEQTKEYRSIAEGGLAFARLVKDQNEFAKLAATRVTLSEQGSAVVASAELTNAEAVELIQVILEY